MWCISTYICLFPCESWDIYLINWCCPAFCTINRLENIVCVSWPTQTPSSKRKLRVVSTHLKNLSKWESSPNRGENKKIFETTIYSSSNPSVSGAFAVSFREGLLFCWTPTSVMSELGGSMTSLDLEGSWIVHQIPSVALESTSTKTSETKGPFCWWGCSANVRQMEQFWEIDSNIIWAKSFTEFQQLFCGKVAWDVTKTYYNKYNNMALCDWFCPSAPRPFLYAGQVFRI